MNSENSDLEKTQRQLLNKAKRIIVKAGTNLLVNPSGRPNRQRILNIVKQIAELHHAGYEVTFVTSGAVGSGMEVLNMQHRPSKIHDLQLAAAVGQTRLLDCYFRYFKKRNCIISQILLTHDDITNRIRHLNARNTIINLLSHRIIPIINENDVVAVDEIRLGDNDILSALVTSLIDADLLILLTTPDGLRKPIPGKKTKRVTYVEQITPEILDLAAGKQDSRSSGGMATKLQAAGIAINVGASVVIASGKQKNVIAKIMQGDDVGTLIGIKGKTTWMDKRKRWIRYYHRPQGSIVVNDCAATALLHSGRSLLPIGIENVEGHFQKGAQVRLMDRHNNVIGFGLVEYDSLEIQKIKGYQSANIESILHYKGTPEVIHRNNLVIEKKNES